MRRGLMDFRRSRALILAMALAACTADVSETPRSPAAHEDGSTISRSETKAEPVEAEFIDSRPDVAPGDAIVTADGWGPLRIGMTLPEITAAAGADAHPDAVGGADPARCDEFRPASAPEGILVMVENGVLTRVSVSRNAGIRTADGFRIGDPASKLVAHYGSRARIEPHKYLEAPAKNIVVWREPRAAANARGIRYEIGADGNIAHIRAGGPSIEYVEGCS